MLMVFSLPGRGPDPVHCGGVAAAHVGRQELVLEDEALGFAAAAEQRAVGVPEEGWAGGLAGPQDALGHGEWEIVEGMVALQTHVSGDCTRQRYTPFAAWAFWPLLRYPLTGLYAVDFTGSLVHVMQASASAHFHQQDLVGYFGCCPED